MSLPISWGSGYGNWRILSLCIRTKTASKFSLKSHLSFRASSSEIFELSANGNLQQGWKVGTFWITIPAEFLSVSFFKQRGIVFFPPFHPILTHLLLDDFWEIQSLPPFFISLSQSWLVGLNKNCFFFTFSYSASKGLCFSSLRGNWQLMSLGRI